LAGQRIGIHVGQKWDAYALAEAQHYLGQQQRDATGNWPDLVGAPGCIIATAFVKEHRLLGASDAKAALIECGTRRWGLVLTDLRMVPFIKAPGKQGIWYHKRPEVA
jgi:hypothetical protein